MTAMITTPCMCTVPRTTASMHLTYVRRFSVLVVVANAPVTLVAAEYLVYYHKTHAALLQV
jgi:hypothetical protein